MAGCGNYLFFRERANLAFTAIYAFLGAGCFPDGFPFAEIMINYFRIARNFIVAYFTNKGSGFCSLPVFGSYEHGFVSTFSFQT